MRIVLLSHYYYPEVGAPQRRWRILVDHLRAAGHDVITVAPHPHYPYSDRNGFFGSNVGRGRRRVDVRLGGTWDTGIDGERILRVPYLHSGSSMTRQLLDQTVSATGAMSAVVDRLRGRMRPDVIISTTPALPFLLAGDTLSRLLRVPHIAEVRDAWPDLISEMNLVTGALSKYLPGMLTHRLEHRLLPDLLTRAQRRAAVVVVTTEGFKHRLEERGVTAEVVRSGVSPAELEGASGLTATGAIPLISPAEETGAGDDVIGKTAADHTGLNLLYVGTVGRSRTSALRFVHWPAPRVCDCALSAAASILSNSRPSLQRKGCRWNSIPRSQVLNSQPIGSGQTPGWSASARSTPTNALCRRSSTP